MTEGGSWSNNSQEFTRMCILESQLEVKDVKVASLEQENLLLKVEVERLQCLVNTLMSKKDVINSSDEVFDRFK
jgi:hypothetical protein